MADEKQAAAASAVSGSGGGGGGSKIVLILSLVNLLATLGMVGVLFISFQRDKIKPSVEDISPHASAEGEGEKPKGKEEEKGHGGGHGGGGHGGKEEDKKKTVNFGKMVALEKFTVNLSTPGSANSKYVLVSISLEVPSEDIEAEVSAKVPQVRNAIIDLFNSKRPSDLATADGREYLKEEIRNALNSFLTTGKVKGVFFTSFALSG